MDYEFYLDYYESFKLRYEVDHCVHPLLNLHHKHINSADVDDFCKKKFNYSFGLCNVLWGGDEALDYAQYLTKKKKIWLKQLKKLEPKKNKKLAVGELSRISKGLSTTMSQNLFKYVEHMKTDPLPGLVGHRNWIFAGGTIALLRADSEFYTITASGAHHLSSLYTFKLNKDCVIIDSSEFELKYDSPILEVSSNKDLENPLVCTRQQNCIHILKPNGTVYTTVYRKISATRNCFFTCASIKGMILVYARNNGTIAVYDIEEKKVWEEQSTVLRSVECTVENIWQRVYWLSDGMWLTNRNSIFQLNENGGIVNNWDLSSALELCDDIRNLFESPCSPNTLYVFTNHYLLHVDASSETILRKWSHMLSRPPDFGGVARFGEAEELIILQSCDAEEVVAVVNGPEAALLPPRLVPSPADTFRQVKLGLTCLDPAVGQRPMFSVIGCLVLPFDGGCHLLSQNAGGDIFTRKIWKKTLGVDKPEEEEERVWQSWQEYEEKCQQLPLHTAPAYTDVVASAPVMKVLKRPCSPPIIKRRRGDVKWRYMNQLKPKFLPTFRDVMAQRVVDVWEVRETLRKGVGGRRKEIYMDDSEEEEMDRTDRVAGWLEQQVAMPVAQLPDDWCD